MDPTRSSNYPKISARAAVFGLSTIIALISGCAPAFDTDRDLPKRGSVGQEIYGVICDRVGAGALGEDLTGASFHDLCHANAAGKFADKVDQTLLPPPSADAVDLDGKPVSIQKQKENRAKAVARVEALAHRRVDLVGALDTVFPANEKIAVKDASCKSSKKAEELLTDEVTNMLGRMGDLYEDGTVPQSTQSLARVVQAFQKNDEAQAAWSRISARQGYRPLNTALGIVRPVLTYPHLRDFANASLSLLSADSRPYDPNPPRDRDGKPLPIAGPGNDAFNRFLQAAHAELLDATPSPKLAPLVVNTGDDHRITLSRPRDNLEMMQEILFAQDPQFGLGSSRFIVRRDVRGYAMIRGGETPAPLVDEDHDGLPDVDAVGRFKTVDGSVAPSPFPFPGAPQAPRDEFERATAQGGLLYEYIDTTHTFAAQLTKDIRPLLEPDPNQKHESLMDFAAGIPVVMGPRVTREKVYASGQKLKFDGVNTATSPALDAIYALGTILADKNADDTLALARELFTTQTPAMARAVGAVNASFDIAQRHPEAKIPTLSTFWDDSLGILTRISQEPGLLEDLLQALADPDSQLLGPAYSNLAKFRDEVTYNPADMNGPTLDVTTGTTGEMSVPVDRGMPINGKNRSALYRFLQLIHDTNGVTACNKDNAHLVVSVGFDIPLPGSFKECELFKIDNLAKFYLDAMVNAQSFDSSPAPRGTLYMRPSLLRLAPFGLTSMLESSSGITGFWPSAGAVVAPTPQYLNRMVFYDFENDTQNSKTKAFVDNLMGPNMGTSSCPERVIDDPDPTAVDASPDGKIHGLRSCQEGQWLRQRNPNTIFTWEHFDFYRASRPVLSAFVKHRREDLFLELVEAIWKRFPGPDATENECRLADGSACPRENMNSYEPLLAEALATDLVPSLGAIVQTLATMQMPGATPRSGIDVAVATTRSMLDPALNVGLTDRKGNTATLRNDGGIVPQLTPAYLLANAVNSIQRAFDADEQQHPSAGRREAFRRGRSQIVDQFLATNGSAFTNPSLPKIAPLLIDVLRAQRLSHCPDPSAPCTWARTDLTKSAEDTLAGPLVTAGLDMVDAVRGDENGRREAEKLGQYLLDSAADDDALANLLASANDVVQLLRDDENLLPLFKVVASAMDATKYDDHGRITQKSFVDAQMSMLARMSGKVVDADGKESCDKEIDPNEVLGAMLAKVVSPTKDGRTPLEIIIDVIADVNRADPTQAYDGTLAKSDYSSVSANVVDFLTNKERGMEQLYEIIRQGTRAAKPEE